MVSPYVIPLFIFATLLIGFRFHYQSILVGLVAAHVWNVEGFLTVVVFTSVSCIFGRANNAAMYDR